MPLEPKNAEAAVLATGQPDILADSALASAAQEGELVDPAAVERAWLEEAERRYQEYLAGGVELIPAFQALAEIRAELRGR